MKTISKINIEVEKISPTIAYCFLSVIGFVFGALVCIVIAGWVNWFAFPAIIILGIGWYKFIYMRNIIYFINEEVIQIRTGVFNFTTNTLELYRVKDYVLTQSFLMRIFKIMTLELHTTESKGEKTRLAGIPESNIAERIRTQVQRARAKSKIIELN